MNSRIKNSIGTIMLIPMIQCLHDRSLSNIVYCSSLDNIVIIWPNILVLPLSFYKLKPGYVS